MEELGVKLIKGIPEGTPPKKKESQIILSIVRYDWKRSPPWNKPDNNCPKTLRNMHHTCKKKAGYCPALLISRQLLPSLLTFDRFWLRFHIPWDLLKSVLPLWRSKALPGTPSEPEGKPPFCQSHTSATTSTSANVTLLLLQPPRTLTHPGVSGFEGVLLLRIRIALSKTSAVPWCGQAEIAKVWFFIFALNDGRLKCRFSQTSKHISRQSHIFTFHISHFHILHIFPHTRSLVSAPVPKPPPTHS